MVCIMIWSAMLHIKDMEYHGMYNDMECHYAVKDNSLQ